ncbi:MAG TPA: hypothetical protein VEJ38_17160 [Candidatus Acidoferrales bacterium]|nr:hypothetical protein [Candidatus Acidoferrales bacterium]
MASDGQTGLMLKVTGFGAAGGFLAWLLMKSTGGNLFVNWNWYASVPTAIVFGAAAAWIGVFVLANTDMSNQARGFAFALLCGIFFKPVIQGGYSFVVGAVSQAQAQSSASTVQDASKSLASALKSAPPAQVTSEVQKTSDAVSTLVQQTAAVPDPGLKQQLDQRSSEAVKTIVEAAPAAPQASVDSLAKIGDAAKKNGNTAVTLNVLSALKTIESNSKDPQAASAAARAAELVRSQ